MATYGLEELRSTMANAWQFGDIRFSKEANDINFEHNTIYPLCLVIEPNSAMPTIYEGWENYSYEVYFCMLWKKEQRQVGTIEQKWDNIQSNANEWLDIVLSTYDKEDLILDDESLQIERLKNFGNDKVLTIKFSFTLQAFRTCFNPKKFYPDNYLTARPDVNAIITYLNTPFKTYTIRYASCTSWIRADGWKTLEVKQGEEYIAGLKNMAAQNYVHPGVQPPHQPTIPTDFFVPKVGATTTNDLTYADMIKTDAYCKNLPFADGKVIKSGKRIATTLTPHYINKSGDVAGGTTAINNQEAILNTYEWTMFFVIEMPKTVNEFHDERIFQTSSNPNLLNTPALKTVDIYFNNNTVIADATLEITLTTGGTASFLISTLVNDVNWHLRDDTTFAIGIAFSQDDENVIVSTQRMTPQTSPGLGISTPYLWGVAQANLLCKWNDIDGAAEKHYTGKFYEALFYNMNMFAASATDVTINDPTGNPNQLQGIEILNKLSDKYNITQ
jgi:hypothetical protein